ncbi:MAG: hypothetical protein HBSAPP02_01270 [Phycisphaerae bacterium]|nr:MAG: DUF1801 domain-containing protein [Planctomycetia bacterium]RIK70950.1 MAG: DUF1801 domain-containing protein [Planctomycetota bacterium]GJQ25095.1 MAG: hypothetical protein HBSAPP02_01270 [Phycisphaerae bacterium]
MQSKAQSVKEYLAELPSDRRAAIEAVRQVILKNLKGGYEEGMTYGMIGYYVPHSLYPAGYHCNPKLPLPFAGLASQKQHMSLYLMSMYDCSDGVDEFRKAWAKTGKKLDMGKCCIRFKKLEDLALDLIGKSIANMPVKKWIEYYETSLRDHRKKKPTAKTSPAAKRKTKATRAK